MSGLKAPATPLPLHLLVISAALTGGMPLTACNGGGSNAAGTGNNSGGGGSSGGSSGGVGNAYQLSPNGQTSSTPVTLTYNPPGRDYLGSLGKLHLIITDGGLTDIPAYHYVLSANGQFAGSGNVAQERNATDLKGIFLDGYDNEKYRITLSLPTIPTTTAPPH